MDVEVRLFATLRHGRFRRNKLEFPQGSTVDDILRQLAVGPHEVGILLVNGSQSGRDCQLKPGDVVSLFPALGGG